MVQRTEASESMIRGKVDPFTKLVRTVETARVDLIGERAVGDKGGRGDSFESALTRLGTSPNFVRAAGG